MSENLRIIYDEFNGPGLILDAGCFEPVNEDHTCVNCLQIFNVSSQGIIVNIKCSLHIKMMLGKYANQIWTFDFASITDCNWTDPYHNAVCYKCLEKFIDKGHAKLKPKDLCNGCKVEYWDEYGWNGDTLDKDKIAYPSYGSCNDSRGYYKFEAFEASKFYCYDCIDKEIKDKNLAPLRK